MTYKVLITTSGVGSRLGKLTKKTNKALIKIGGKEIISYIIDIYPENIELVITLGYYGCNVKKFLNNKYPNRKITYVNINNYEGQGSSLGYSILCAKNKLNIPFILHCNDTIVNKYIPLVNNNWVGGHKVNDSNQYTTFKINGEFISSYNTKKGAMNYDFAHIGVVGIYEHKTFFNILDNVYKNNPNNSSLNDVIILDKMLKQGSTIKNFEFNKWLDTGNIESLKINENKIKNLLH